MKSYKEFLLERAFSPQGQAARVKMRAQAGQNAARKAAQQATPKALSPVGGTGKQLALPPGKTGGALGKARPTSLAQTPADKGASIVRSKRGGTGKEAVGAPRKTGPGVRTPAPPRGDGTKSYNRVQQPAQPAGKLAVREPQKKRKITYGDRVGHASDRQFGNRAKTLKDKFRAHNVGKNIANTVYDAPRNIAKGVMSGAKNALAPSRNKETKDGKITKVKGNGNEIS